MITARSDSQSDSRWNGGKKVIDDEARAHGAERYLNLQGLNLYRSSTPVPTWLHQRYAVTKSNEQPLDLSRPQISDLNLYERIPRTWLV